MGLRHLLADDDRLHRHQRPLWGDAGRGDRRFARTDGILLLPDVFRLRGQLPGTGDFRTPVRPLHPRHRGHGRRAGRRRAGRRMAGGHDRRRDNLRAAFPALLPPDARTRRPGRKPVCGRTVDSVRHEIARRQRAVVDTAGRGGGRAALQLDPRRGGSLLLQGFHRGGQPVGRQYDTLLRSVPRHRRNRQHARGRTGRTHLAAHR